MNTSPAWRRYLRFWGPDPQSDIDDELQFHLQTKTDNLIAAGMPPGDARREALRQFGPVRTVRNECYSIDRQSLAKASRAEYLAGWLRDLKYAVRVLCRSKASSAAVILILAAGIGTNTAVFTFLDRLLFRPLPLPNPSELLLVSNSAFDDRGTRSPNDFFPYDAYAYLRDRNQAFAGLAAQSGMAPRERRKGQKIERPAQAAPVSGNFFEVLGREPLLGRALVTADDASHVAVASYRFWKHRYNLAGDVLGRTVYLNDLPFTIVGVMPAGFFGIQQGSDPDLYVPLGSLRELFGFDILAHSSVRLIGRLRPGVAAQSAQSNLQVLWGQFLKGGKPAPRAGERIECRDGSAGYAGIGGEKQRSLVLLAAIVGLLLLMGCVNVACLLAARGVARQHEIAIRLSLGAGRLRILRQSLIESCLLALVGGAAGVLVAFWADGLLLIGFQWQNRPIDLSPDWRILAFGLGLSLAAGLVFGLAPALQFPRRHVLLTQDRTVAPRFSFGKALVVVEVSLSLVMVTCAAMFIRSFRNLSSVPTGFNPDNVSVIELASAGDEEFPGAAIPQASRLADSLGGAPGIDSAGLSDFVTFNDAYVRMPLKAARDAGAQTRNTHVLLVNGSYFAALQIPLIAGRTFSARDDARAPKVAILTEGTARRLFPGRNPIGTRVLLGNDAMHPESGSETEIVGVVKDIKFTSLANAAPDLVFQPFAQGVPYTPTPKLQVRSRLEPRDVAASVRSRIQEAHLKLRVESVSALEDRIGASLQNDRFRMLGASLFGTLALLLVMAGIHGLMAYSVVRRTREIGIRMSMGSTAAGILRLVLDDSLRLVLYGLILGVPGSIAAMKSISGMVFGLSPIDPASIGIAGLTLSAVAIVAGFAPAWRAAHLDPVEALRIQ